MGIPLAGIVILTKINTSSGLMEKPGLLQQHNDRQLFKRKFGKSSTVNHNRVQSKNRANF